ncbi:Gustatory receptor 188c [Halyomorpha halys]|nr:Gustatory receptor 188c [Halyomorpha halys]
MGQNIFGFLKYLGTPYNLKKRPGTIQILIFFLTTALSVWTAWKHSKPSFARDGDWYVYLIIFLMRSSEATAMVLFSARNLRPGHPLIAILDEIVDDEDKRNHTVWFNLGLGATLPNLMFMIYDVSRTSGISIPFTFAVVKELIFLIHLAQVLVPLHAITSRVSRIRCRLHSYGDDRESNPSPGISELIVIEKRLEEAFIQLTEEYGKDFIRILYISTGRITMLLSGSLAILLIDMFETHIYLIKKFFLEIMSPMYRIWSVVHAAQLVRYQMEKFRSELYTKCLEDQSGNLAKNDMMSVFLERGLSHVSFTANGFLPLDHSLFCRMLSSAVTWVFIIIQFRIRDQ